MKFGRRKEAIKCFKKSLIINPLIFSNYSHLGGLLVEEKRIEEGLRFCRIALKINQLSKGPIETLA